uniref:Uncharacterized protein n=1 Tax=Anguilla anguilla TaxID=7936 RepID=A0A0E9VFW9_ANGAN
MKMPTSYMMRYYKMTQPTR